MYHVPYWVSNSRVDPLMHIRLIHLLTCTSQHNVVPSRDLVTDITHVILAFMQSDVFNVQQTPSEFPLFTTVEEVRSQFEPGTKVNIAIGGWGDGGFEEAARDETSRKRWSKHVGAMVEATGADGVDIDWEYPGYVQRGVESSTSDSHEVLIRKHHSGNRDDYKKIPNSEREWEIDAFVQLLKEVRAAVGPDKLLSIAVPSEERDLMAFTASTIPSIIKEVDFINVMTYDMMNRRDTVVKHHSGVRTSHEALGRYMDRGAPAHQLNMGLGYYVKWFMTQDCDSVLPLGCPTQLLEDPETGADLGRTGAFSWHDAVPPELDASFARALAQGAYDNDDGGSFGYWDSEERRWWSLDTPRVVRRKFADVVRPMGLGGVFAWGLGEDAPGFERLRATTEAVRAARREGDAVRDEL